MRVGRISQNLSLFPIVIIAVALAESSMKSQRILDNATENGSALRQLIVLRAGGEGDDEGCSAGTGDAASLQLRVKRDQAAIQSLGFQQKSEDIEAWTKLAGNARTKFMRDTFDMLLANTNAALDAGGSLNPPSANRLISDLRAANVDFEPLNNAIRSLASTPGKPATAKQWRDLIDAFQRAKDSPVVARSIVEGDQQSRLEALSKALGWLERDPNFALLAADLQFTTSSAYNNFARRVSQDQIDKLTALSENDLEHLKSLSKQLETDVRAWNAACSQQPKTLTGQEYERERQKYLAAYNAASQALQSCFKKIPICFDSCVAGGDTSTIGKWLARETECQQQCGSCKAEEAADLKAQQALYGFEQDNNYGYPRKQNR